MRIPFIVLVPLIAACGGSHLYDVRSTPTTPGDEAGGVPFLPMQSVDVEKIVYAQEWLEIDVTGTFQQRARAVQKPTGGAPPAKAGSEQTPKPDSPYSKHLTAFTADTSPAALEPAMALYADFVKSANAARAWENVGLGVANAVAQHKLSITIPAPPADVTQVQALQRVAEDHARAQVPAATPLYFNVKVPYGGSANAELDLAGNGTMTKGISGKQDTFPGTVATAVGTLGSAALGGALGTPATAAAATATSTAASALQDSEATYVLSVDLKLVPRRRLFTVTLTHPSGLRAADCGPIDRLLGPSPSSPGAVAADASPCRAGVAVELRSGDDADEAKKKDDDNIQFSGAVKLPKPAADKDGAK